MDLGTPPIVKNKLEPRIKYVGVGEALLCHVITLMCAPAEKQAAAR